MGTELALSDKQLREKVDLVVDQYGHISFAQVVKRLYQDGIITYFFNWEGDKLMLIGKKDGELLRHPNIYVDPFLDKKIFTRSSSALEREKLTTMIKTIEVDLGSGFI